MQLDRLIRFQCRQGLYVFVQSERIPDLNDFCRAFGVVGGRRVLLKTLPSNGLMQEMEQLI